MWSDRREFLGGAGPAVFEPRGNPSQRHQTPQPDVGEPHLLSIVVTAIYVPHSHRVAAAGLRDCVCRPGAQSDFLVANGRLLARPQCYGHYKSSVQ